MLCDLPLSTPKMVPILDGNVMIEDIRHNDIGPSMIDQIYDGLHPRTGDEKRLPTLLLYDEKGLQLFEEISYLDEYYLTNAEIELLREHAINLANMIPEGCIVLELGSGYGSTLSERENPSPSCSVRNGIQPLALSY